jgi:hypothetical protein
MQWQGHEHHYESGGAIHEMYYRCGRHDSYETIPGEEYYDSFTCGEYGTDLQDNYGFQDSVGYHDDGYHEYEYHYHGAPEVTFRVNSPFQGERIYDPYGGGYLENMESYKPTPYHPM